LRPRFTAPDCERAVNQHQGSSLHTDTDTDTHRHTHTQTHTHTHTHTHSLTHTHTHAHMHTVSRKEMKLSSPPPQCLDVKAINNIGRHRACACACACVQEPGLWTDKQRVKTQNEQTHPPPASARIGPGEAYTLSFWQAKAVVTWHACCSCSQGIQLLSTADNRVRTKPLTYAPERRAAAPHSATAYSELTAFTHWWQLGRKREAWMLQKTTTERRTPGALRGQLSPHPRMAGLESCQSSLTQEASYGISKGAGGVRRCVDFSRQKWIEKELGLN
jgi:hypothetical protein